MEEAKEIFDKFVISNKWLSELTKEQKETLIDMILEGRAC